MYHIKFEKIQNTCSFAAEEKINMNKKRLLKDNKAQVLGLPMYLIIIMIVAVAVIAAVIFMMPQGTQQMTAQVTQNALIAEDPGAVGAGEFNFTGDFPVEIKVTTNDEDADPVNGATVTLKGAGIYAQGSTNGNGICSFAANYITPKLDSNINEDYVTLTVSASGYETLEMTKAITVVRDI